MLVFQPASGGVPAYVATLADGLVRRGWRITVVAPEGCPAADRMAEAGATVLRMTMARGPSPRGDARAVGRLAAVCRERDVDVMHAHSSKAGLVAALAGRRAGVPTLYTPHCWSFGMRAPLPARIGLAALEAALARRCHAGVIAVSLRERYMALSWGIAREDEVVAIRTGVPEAPAPAPTRAESRAALALPEEAFVVAWVGRNARQKRPGDLAEIQARLGDEVVVAALGHELEGSDAGDALVAADGRVMPGGSSALHLYAAADVFLQTSEWEELPLTVIEAMRAALPVVAYRVGALEELVDEGRTGHLVPARQVDEAADALRRLARDPALRERMGGSAREHYLRSHSWERMVEAVERIYMSRITRPAPHAAGVAA